MRTFAAGAGVLLAGFGILELGDGLLGTLLALRAGLEGFPTGVTGVIMSLFYVGFLGGCLTVDRLIRRVGHVRVFGALASVASAAVLIHGMFVNPLSWCVLRFVSGFCFAGLYVVTESWLNARATNENRGRLLSLYMIVAYAGIAGGQMLLNVAPPTDVSLFVLTSVLISIALVPLLLSAGPVPDVEDLEPVGARELLAISPLGVFGAFAVGTATGAMFGMGPVFAAAAGMSVGEVSVFMTALVVGAMVLQWPIGRLSDRFDRRRVLTAVTFLATAAAAAGALAVDTPFAVQVLLFGLLGGLSIPLYAVSIAHANDYLAPEQIVAASAGLVLANGVGAVLGPVSVSGAMALAGPAGFYWALAAVHAAIGVFALYRMVRRPSVPLEAQGPWRDAGYHSTPWAVEWSQRDARTDDP